VQIPRLAALARNDTERARHEGGEHWHLLVQ
jgi:hypothetical protein